MSAYKLGSALLVVVLGLVSLIFGIMFIIQAGSAEQEIADQLNPLKIAEVDSKYDTVDAKQKAMAGTEEPEIQAGKAAPSTTYNYLSKINFSPSRFDHPNASYLL